MDAHFTLSLITSLYSNCLVSISLFLAVHTAARLQRYSLILASYNYKLEFWSTKFHVDADCMPRVPMTTTFDPPLVNLNCNFFSTVTNINQNAVKRLTQRHPLLSKVYRYIVSGWPDTTDPSFTPFRTRKDELSTEDGCILWGQRVIVPPSLQKDVLRTRTSCWSSRDLQDESSCKILHLVAQP